MTEPHPTGLPPFWLAFGLEPRTLTFGWESGLEYWEVRYSEIAVEDGRRTAIPKVYANGQLTKDQVLPSQIAQRIGQTGSWKHIIPWLESGDDEVFAELKRKYEDG